MTLKDESNLLLCREHGCKDYRVTACYCDKHQKLHRGRKLKVNGKFSEIKCSICKQAGHNKRTHYRREIVAKIIAEKGERAA